MAEAFVTLFDSFYLPQGYALYSSLLKHHPDFVLYIACLDKKTYNFFEERQFPFIIPIEVSTFETEELIEIKKERTRGEYCWTITPWVMTWVFDINKKINRLTYLDADVFFLNSPLQIFSEFTSSGKSFLITGHSYAPKYDQTKSSGRYCVQFVVVKRDTGFPALFWWKDRCTEWCFARFEDGKFGDQKYIETVASLFESEVLAIDSDSRFLAPWNASYYRYSDAILYHFHGFRIINYYTYVLTETYDLPKPVTLNVYGEYISLFKSFHDKFGKNYFKRQLSLSTTQKIKYALSVVLYPLIKLKNKFSLFKISIG